MLTLPATNRATGQPLDLVIGDATIAQFLEQLRGELLRTAPPMSRKQYATHKGVSVDTIKRWLRKGLPREQRSRRARVWIPVQAADQWLSGKEPA